MIGITATTVMSIDCAANWRTVFLYNWTFTIIYFRNGVVRPWDD